ncbi:MAG TPA: hypothetical protein EYG03_25225 [Planctomycetes bacterium]|nr:hypothetical protein [Fuerstiella sp.]HIK95259.1 hypothetical protein [Planctomycetota bacterium]
MSTTETVNPTETEASRLAGVEKELNTLERRLKREALISTIMTVVVLLVLSFYFMYGYREFSKLLQPSEIVGLGAALVDENVTVLRESIQDEVESGAPVWAEQLSSQAIAAVPLVREELEKFAVAQAKDAIEQYVTISQDEFRRVLKENHAEFQGLVTELSKEGEATDEVVAALEEVLNKELGGDMEVAAADLVETLQLANHKLVRLGADTDLDDDEQKERLVMMLFRRIQMDEGSKAEQSGDETSPLSIFDTPLKELGLSDPIDAIVTPVVTKTNRASKSSVAATPNVVKADPVSKSPKKAATAAAARASVEAAAAAAAEKQARAAEEAAQKAAGLQEEAAKSAASATKEARVATKEAREATAEARTARDELRAAEKDARAAIQELLKLQKQLANKPEPAKPEPVKDDSSDEKDSPAADDVADDKEEADAEEPEKASASDESS